MLAFVAVKTGTVLEPLAPKPMFVLAFVQANVVPATGLVKEIAVDCCPVHKVILAWAFTVGLGIT